MGLLRVDPCWVACKGVWWMPWRTGPMKDVAGCDKPRGAVERALIRGFPNGGTRPPSWVVTGFGRGVRREVKHLSTCRKGYSVSSGERKRIRPNHARVIGAGRCARGVVGECVRASGGLGGSDKTVCEANRIGCRAAEGDGPVAVRAWSAGRFSQVARASWNPA